MDHFGLLNIDKPAGLTSPRIVVDQVQQLVRPAKVGHAGTLDPLATGVLLVCIGRATRLVPLIQELHKTYRATFLLGRTSNTDDTEGDAVELPHAPIPTSRQILDLLPEFVGRIPQQPPVYSAVKVRGRRAYSMARQGEQVSLSTREVDVYRIELLRYEYPELVLEIECGSGTYIRSIGRDLGERLACGALMNGLVRTSIGPFKLEAAIALDHLTRDQLPNCVLPPLAATTHLPHIVVEPQQVRRLVTGSRIPLPGDSPNDAGRVAVVDEQGTLIAIAEVADGLLIPRLVLAARSR